MDINHLLKSTRQYFWDLGFDEVEVPYLNPSLPLEPNIYSFSTIHRHSGDKFYLPTSPEFALKRHLATTHRSCFAITHCFRDLESESPLHTKEFLMLEYYLVNKNLTDLQKSLENYLSLFIRNLKFEIFNLPSDLPDNEPDFNQFFLNNIEPNLPDNPVFITGYPAYLSPLAATSDAGNFTNSESNFFSAHSDRVTPAKAEGQPEGSEHCKKYLTSKRFELYIDRIEIANGCEELRDPHLIRQSFINQQNYRLKNNLPTHPYSEEFIEICSKLPPCSGVGLGLERLLSVINNQ